MQELINGYVQITCVKASQGFDWNQGTFRNAIYTLRNPAASSCSSAVATPLFQVIAQHVSQAVRPLSRRHQLPNSLRIALLAHSSA